MKHPHAPRSKLPSGAVSSIASVVGVVALLAFILPGSGPPPLPLPALTVPAAASVPWAESGRDPSVPSASSVFGGRNEEPAGQIETF